MKTKLLLLPGTQEYYDHWYYLCLGIHEQMRKWFTGMSSSLLGFKWNKSANIKMPSGNRVQFVLVARLYRDTCKPIGPHPRKWSIPPAHFEHFGGLIESGITLRYILLDKPPDPWGEEVSYVCEHGDFPLDVVRGRTPFHWVEAEATYMGKAPWVPGPSNVWTAQEFKQLVEGELI